MTVQELINELNEIEDKTKQVMCDDLILVGTEETYKFVDIF